MTNLINVKLKTVKCSEFYSLVLPSTNLVIEMNVEVLTIRMNNGTLEVGCIFTWLELEHMRDPDKTIRRHIKRMERELLSYA